MLRFLTAGESHGRALVVIVYGLPAGLSFDFDAITRVRRRRWIRKGPSGAPTRRSSHR
jgi:chorismate synthase